MCQLIVNSTTLLNYICVNFQSGYSSTKQFIYTKEVKTAPKYKIAVNPLKLKIARNHLNWGKVTYKI